jgi:hypothetical protein
LAHTLAKNAKVANMPAIKGYTDLYHLQLFAKKWRTLSKNPKTLAGDSRIYQVKMIVKSISLAGFARLATNAAISWHAPFTHCCCYYRLPS